MNIQINKIEELDAAAHTLLNSYTDKKFFAFYGNMGVGKTTFIKSLCKELGVIDNGSSPTFSLVNEYKTNTNNSVYHFDFYRINKLSEAYDMGYEEYFYNNNYCFVEWPDKIESLLPKDAVKVNITQNQNGSRVIMVKD